MARTVAQISGDRAEQRACWQLRLYGWRIAARNWIGGGGELDIVASRWRTLLVVEVRRRATTTAALASINRDKYERTMSAARALVHAHNLEAYTLRFDAMGYDDAGHFVWVKDIVRTGQIGN
jgi:putative endonuclease